MLADVEQAASADAEQQKWRRRGLNDDDDAHE
jgi:hypothetical protein